MHGAAFYLARKELLNITVHAGESFGPASIRQALFKCGAHRIGHGVTLGQDPELLRYVVDRQIPLEVCPTSNVQTGAVASYEAHPVAEYCRAGVPVTVSTDNTLFSHTTTTDELWLAHTRCGIPAEALREIVLNGFRLRLHAPPRQAGAAGGGRPAGRRPPGVGRRARLAAALGGDVPPTPNAANASSQGL